MQQLRATTGPGARSRIRDHVAIRRNAALAASMVGLAAAGAGGPASAQAAPDGSRIYVQQGCAGCHGMDGEGRTSVAPPLAGNEHLDATHYVISQVLIGRGTMPAFRDDLSNAEVAAVVNHVRTSWGNDFALIEPERVADVRRSPSVEAFPTAGPEHGGQAEVRADQQAAAAPAPPAEDESVEAARGERAAADIDIHTGEGAPASELVHVPVVNLYPGDVPVRPSIDNPADDPQAVHRGKTYFNQFNCVGCHAPNGAGGMGPSLSNAHFVYGREPENIYLSILQGRPVGMPAWGGMLPDHIIWDLVVYIRSISRDPDAGGEWGSTTSAGGFTIEQVPAEFLSTVNPWQYTQPFSYGQAPFEKPKGSPPLETPGR